MPLSDAPPLTLSDPTAVPPDGIAPLTRLLQLPDWIHSLSDAVSDEPLTVTDSMVSDVAYADVGFTLPVVTAPTTNRNAESSAYQTYCGGENTTRTR